MIDKYNFKTNKSHDRFQPFLLRVTLALRFLQGPGVPPRPRSFWVNLEHRASRDEPLIPRTCIEQCMLSNTGQNNTNQGRFPKGE